MPQEEQTVRWDGTTREGVGVHWELDKERLVDASLDLDLGREVFEIEAIELVVQLVDSLLIAETVHAHFAVFGLHGFQKLLVLDAFKFAEVGLVELLRVQVVSAVVQREVGGLGDGDPGTIPLQWRWVSGAYFWVCGVRGGTHRGL